MTGKRGRTHTRGISPQGMAENHWQIPRGIRFAWRFLVTSEPSGLWEIHLRIRAEGPVSIACKRGGERLTEGVMKMSTPSDALQMLELLLEHFAEGDELFITARTHGTSLSMWSTQSRAVGLYWCAAALSQLWRPRKDAQKERPRLLDLRRRLTLSRS